MSLFKSPARRRIARKSLTRANVYRWMRMEHLPLQFLVRNLAYLEREAWFARKAPVARVRLAAVLFLERVWCFREVRRLIALHREEPGWRKEPARSPNDPTLSDGSYCSHCGGCCEIASGLPEFPDESGLPLEWRECFGEGLGAGHRFCAFMWEGDRPGTSQCAIHPWRANPCRVFEADDCAFFMQDSDFISFTQSPRLKDLRRLLPRILRRRVT